jgi:uncharacterized iron-regulated membrane protein
MGGIGLALLVILLVLIVGGVIVMYVTGGALWWRKTDPEQDRVEGDEPAGEERRPKHTHPTTPYHDNTEFVGTRQSERDER